MSQRTVVLEFRFVGHPFIPDLARRKPRLTPLDIAVFPMDNSGTRTEGVSHTSIGFDGDAPLAAYLGREGWCLACELRPGSQHGQNEFIHFLERVVPRPKALSLNRFFWCVSTAVTTRF